MGLAWTCVQIIQNEHMSVIQVTPDMVIHAPTPARLLTEFHDKHVLVIGQEYRTEIAEEYPFRIRHNRLHLYVSYYYSFDKHQANKSH